MVVLFVVCFEKLIVFMECTSFKIVVGMNQTMIMGGADVTTATKSVLNFFKNKFHFISMSVDLSAISFISTLFLLSFLLVHIFFASF